MNANQKRIVFANQKGGVGKTVSAVSLAGVFSQQGYRVLLVDCDPQANASLALGIRPADFDQGVADLFEDPDRFSGQAATVHTDSGIDLLASDLSLSQVEWDAWQSRPENLFQTLAKGLEGTDHEFVIIDTPPALGIFTLSALTAAHRVLIPVAPEPLGLIGMQYLVNNINQIRFNTNHKLKVLGFFRTFWSSDGSRLFSQLQEQIEGYELPLLESAVPVNVKVKEAVVAGVPITHLQGWAPAAKGYKKLAEEVIERW